MPTVKGRLEAQLHHRPHLTGTGERVDQVHYAIGPIVKVQRIKNLIPELSQSVGTHTFLIPYFSEERKRNAFIPEVSPKSR